MTTPLNKTLRRQILVNGQEYIVTLSPEGLKITGKGKRKGLELDWNALVSGDAALAIALNASVGQLAAPPAAPPTPPAKRVRKTTKETTGRKRRSS